MTGHSTKRRRVPLATSLALAVLVGAGLAIAATQGGRPAGGTTVLNAAAGASTEAAISAPPALSALTPIPTSAIAEPTHAPSDAPPAVSAAVPASPPSSPTRQSAPAQSGNGGLLVYTGVGLPGPSEENMAPPGTWTQCAVEYATCPIDAPMVVAYGKWQGFTYRTVISSLTCTGSNFGAPNPSPVAQMVCYSAPAPSTSSSSPWSKCADENATCQFAGVMMVAYGADGKYAYATLGGGGTACSNSVFGDPDYDTVKSCYFMASPPQFTEWLTCAAENNWCDFPGRGNVEVAYGAQGRYSYGFFDDRTPCSAAVFGDPDPGVTKICYEQYYDMPFYSPTND